MAPLSARAADAVKTRAGEHEHFGRIAFDWPAPVTFEAKIDGGTLTIHFGRGLETSLGSIADNIGGYVENASIGADGTTLTAHLKRPVTLKTFTEGNTIAIDLVDAASAAVRKAAAKSSGKAMPAQPASTVATAPASTPSAPDKPTVAVRSGEHEGYRRLVLEWTKPYKLTEIPGGMRVHFPRAVAIDTDRVSAALPGARAELVDDSAGGTTLTLQVPDGGKLRHFRSDEGNIVLDLVAGAAATAKIDQPKTRQAHAKSAVASPPPAPVEPAATAAPAAPALVPPPELIEPSAGSGASGPLPPATKPGQPGAPQRLVPGPSSESESSKAAATAATPTPAPAPAPPPSDLAVHYAAATDVASLRFAWTKPVPLAVFRRAGALWIVFGAATEPDLTELQERGKAAIERVEQVPNGEATVLRAVTRRGLEPSIRRVGNEWVVDLKAQDFHVDGPATMLAQPDGRPPHVTFEIQGSSEPIVVNDPEVGDRLLVLPTTEVGRGMAQESSVVEFRALVSAQGLVLRPNLEGVVARLVGNGIEVTGPGGLVLSADADRLLGTAVGAIRLFDFPGWAGPPKQAFLDRRSELERVVSTTPANQRSQPRLALAQFYFARLYSAEALGVLDAIERDDPAFAADRLVRAMRGAAALLTGDREQAIKELNRPTLDRESEVALWRGALAANDGDWRTAAPLFLRGAGLLNTYPKLLRDRFELVAAEALIRTGNADAAGTLLGMVRKDDPTPSDLSMTRYLEGLRAQARGDMTRSLEIWQEVARSDDRPSRARALKDRAMVLLEIGKISRADAIQQLDALRFSWRGDTFEFDLLHTLGTLLIADGDYRRGLDVLRQAAANYPRHPETPMVQTQMADAFGQVFTGKNADTISPIKALALYQEFKGVTAPNGKSDEIVRHLADRLIKVDLLDQADTLLEDQATNRLTGAAKARTATELALIRLLDHRPDAALRALDIPVGTDLAQDLARQRQQLRARALLDLKKPAEALAALSNDQSRAADRLRADVYWKTKSWQDAVRVFERIVDVPQEGETLAPKDAQVVLNWAAALTLSGDQAGVARLRDRFGAAMAKSAYAAGFRLIASDDAAAGKSDPRARARQIAEIGELKSFAAELRKSLSGETAPADGSAPATGAATTTAPATN
jgi:tetratricopeptide (TPR) repeat protein